MEKPLMGKQIGLHIENTLPEIGLLRSFYQATRNAQFPATCVHRLSETLENQLKNFFTYPIDFLTEI